MSRVEDISHQQFFFLFFKGQLVLCGSHRRHESLVLRPQEDALGAETGVVKGIITELNCKINVLLLPGTGGRREYRRL